MMLSTLFSLIKQTLGRVLSADCQRVHRLSRQSRKFLF